METQVKESPTAPAEPAPTAVDELLGQLRERPSQEISGNSEAFEPSTLRLTLDEASELYLVLREKAEAGPAPPPPEADARLPRPDLAKLFKVLEERLRKTSSATDESTTIALELRRFEAGYLKTIVENKKRDQDRRQRTYYEYFPSRDALLAHAEERADEEGDSSVPAYLDPPGPTTPEIELMREHIARALAVLPPEQRALLSALQDADGNVSELARRLGQPQRRTARQIARIGKLLRKKGVDGPRIPRISPKPASSSEIQDLDMVLEGDEEISFGDFFEDPV